MDRLGMREAGRRFLSGIVLVLCAVGFAPRAVEAQVAVPYSESERSLSVGSPVYEFAIDMLTLPLRPEVHLAVTAAAAHADMTLDVELVECDVFEFFRTDPPDPPYVQFSGDPCPFDWSTPPVSGAGSATSDADLWRCWPAVRANPPAPQCTVRVTAVDFGSSPPPALVDISVTAISEVPSAFIELDLTGTTQASGEVVLDVVPFEPDADQFRWIYDEEQDLVVESFIEGTTQARGQCTFVDDFDPTTVSLVYTSVGDPTFVGFDCCAFELASSSFGNLHDLGGGQLLARRGGMTGPPPDSDRDGIADACDNCVETPNGPNRGVCVPNDASTGLVVCLSNLDCDPLLGQVCDRAQRDGDFDRSLGFACPEPGVAVMLSTGLLGLTGLSSRRRRRLGSIGAELDR